jgi:EmrB/QacA subfamily drug resistance transporter
MAQTTEAPASGGARELGPQSFHSELSRGRLILVVASVMLGMLLGSLDQTIVGTAMPRVIADLNGLEHYAWVFTAYMLASTVMVPVYGKLSDIYGRKPFFLGGMALFLLGSALSGTSQSMTQLIAFRAIQGLGAGAMMPIVQAIIGDIFPPAERGKWQGVMMSVFGLSSIVGPTAGGWITDNWGWRWTFYVNMPVGAVALVFALLFLPTVSRRQQHRIDYLGAALLAAAAVPMLLAFSWAGTQFAWGSLEIVGLLVFAAVMWVAFFLVETRAAEPIISPRLFRNRIFTSSVIATFMVSVGMFGAILYLPLFVQAVLGASATNSGTALTPMMLGFIVSSIVGGQLLSRTGRYKILALVGIVVAAVGMYLLSTMGVATSQLTVMENMVVAGLGLGVMMSLFTIVVQNAFPFQQLGQVTASLQFFRSIGGTIGVAVLGTVMTNRFQDALRSNLPAAITSALPPDRLAALQNPQVLLSPAATNQIQRGFAALGPQGQVLFQQFMDALRLSLAQAITGLFLVSLTAMCLAFVATLFLREIPLRKSHRAAEHAEAEGVIQTA